MKIIFKIKYFITGINELTVLTFSERSIAENHFANNNIVR